MLATLGGFAAEFEKMNPEAERLYAEKSFAQAHATYEAMDVSKLSAEERRWVEFRRADTLWRSVENEADADEGKTALDEAEKVLRSMVESRDRADEQDRVWAEAEESLGQLLLHTRDRIRPMRLRRPINGGESRHEGFEHLEKGLGRPAEIAEWREQRFRRNNIAAPGMPAASDVGALARDIVGDDGIIENDRLTVVNTAGERADRTGFSGPIADNGGVLDFQIAHRIDAAAQSAEQRS